MTRITGPTPATEAINWIYASYNRAKPAAKAGYDRDVRHPEWTDRMLDALGRPDLGGYNVAITGSKGKGSHAILLAGMLQRMGLRVGLFTGPHLVDFMERFRIDGEVMPEDEFVRLVERVRPVADALPVPQEQYLGPVGLLAVVAALWFSSERTDVNVYELGRGAQHDDVNRVRHRGAVVAPVFLEHREQLGPTLTDVAREKSGVITPDTRWVVSHRQDPVPQAVFEQAAAQAGIPFLCLGRDFDWTSADGGKLVQVDLGGRRVDIRLPDGDNEYLAGNAAVALAAALRIWADLRPGRPLPEEVNLSDLRLPGRMEVVGRAPWVAIDGTIHGRSAIHAARWAHRHRGPGGRVGVILGLPADKDGPGVLEALWGTADWLVFARAHNPHLRFDGEWARLARSRWHDVTEASFIEDALARAMPRLQPADVLLILGTQSFVGDALAAFDAETARLWRSRPIPDGAKEVGMWSFS
ncbi:bifunctional folylpolyglutamate synthase/dihydrofolate synthase [Alicyclobacillus sp.]|uniref:bifunctional folylpolyglutamate synthase/dihydrofolate synthase n=1 Tax=Alicyclobacillus sp. TaxID=61169 RepID=UPI0025BCE7D8|nr:bifunctional folylpolyglutamate synthase/dihydrofolate synthase [Alicyclobacillus sp.]MCL6517411.1 bifunctional folylpolyglutamate synthase/dihydrofolate synthase [Alicyclobacillus sp.]